MQNVHFYILTSDMTYFDSKNVVKAFLKLLLLHGRLRFYEEEDDSDTKKSLVS